MNKVRFRVGGMLSGRAFREILQKFTWGVMAAWTKVERWRR